MPISILRYQRAWHTFKICHTLQIFKNDSFFIDEQMILLSFFDLSYCLKVAKNAEAFLSRCSELFGVCNFFARGGRRSASG